MKRLILTCSIISAASIASFGQGVKTADQAIRTPQGNKVIYKSATPEATAEKKATACKKQLGLSEDQYKAIYAAELQYAQETASAKKDAGSGQASQMLEARYMNALTPDQYSKYQASKSKTANPGN